MHIRIIGPALAPQDERLAPERLHDFIGHTLEANGQTVAMLREVYGLPKPVDQVYEVALADALEVLMRSVTPSDEAVIAWGQLIDFGLVTFPQSSVEIETE